MAKTSILLKMGLDTSQLKAGVEKAKTQVGGFAKTASAKLEGLKKSFSGINGILTGAVVGGFVAAAKSAMNYATEIDRMARLSGEGVERFQELAAGARMVGVDSGKLADILKDTSDKMGDFLEADSGGAKDFFENIAGGADLTRESFENLSGSG